MAGSPAAAVRDQVVKPSRACSLSPAVVDNGTLSRALRAITSSAIGQPGLLLLQRFIRSRPARDDWFGRQVERANRDGPASIGVVHPALNGGRCSHRSAAAEVCLFVASGRSVLGSRAAPPGTPQGADAVHGFWRIVVEQVGSKAVGSIINWRPLVRGRPRLASRTRWAAPRRSTMVLAAERRRQSRGPRWTMNGARRTSSDRIRSAALRRRRPSPHRRWTAAALVDDRGQLL